MSRLPPGWSKTPEPLPLRHPDDVLWQMKKAGRVTECDLRRHDASTLELQFFYQNSLINSQRYPTRALALKEAVRQQRRLEREGWRVVSMIQSNG